MSHRFEECIRLSISRQAVLVFGLFAFSTLLGCDGGMAGHNEEGKFELVESSPSSESLLGNEKALLESLAANNELFLWSCEVESKSEGGLYVSKLKDFKMPYSMDKVNQAKQSWKDYSDWIPSFYNGNMISSGWNAKAKKQIGDLKSKTVERHFNIVGRVIAAEWAKDNDVRKITTSDLGEFAEMLTANESEEKLLEQLETLAQKVHSKFAD